MKLNEIADRPGAKHARKRVGRGIGSGLGKTAGRGHKGQKSRSGVAIKGFEGGQMPLHRRLPKRGFNNISAKSFAVVNLDRIQTAIDAGKLDAKQAVTSEILVAAGIARRTKDGVRLLGGGELTAKVSFQVQGASKNAVAAVEKAGGSIEIAALAPKAAAEPPKSKKAAERASKAKTPAAKTSAASEDKQG
ncbi:50S ribosomal protein L15 [Microbaculum marinisediminis]|uniref:Large ribosomal subunit protein uL15 n=1 Tax=Microbaculum marinisediminis TaxID=2931392 RepID=A0AAW5R523_9HYPH|nr:50S ribosomal protein L15 [Microbaculum sp. A6E488]MCT8974497.1 50S ribosomal protein L15 [Microbaculum sp. A6E488]